MTIVADLDTAAPAPPGWHRLLTDDPRLLRLLAQVSDPGGPLDTALDGAASLWGVRAERIGRVWRLESDGATVALATPSGGERERPCEIVTPPLVADHLAGHTPHFEIESRMLHKDGVFRWMLTRGLMITDDAGAPLRIICGERRLERRPGERLG